MSAVFRYALRHGAVASNPAVLVEWPGRPPAQIRYLTLDQIDALLEHVPRDLLGPTDRVLYLTAAFTGLRRGELVALRWRDVDHRARVVRVRRSFSRGQLTLPKTQWSNRAVPLAARLADEIQHHRSRSQFREPDDLVFAHPVRGGYYDPARLRRRFVQTARAAGLPATRFHDLRHTFGTQIAAAGAPMRAIQAWMGHGDYRTTSIYIDYVPDPAANVLFADRAFGEQADTTIASTPLRLMSP